ncbi:excinuclease ABC subunit A (plasmid) [Rhodococcus erythropolis]|nr:excinuclease ABC subunit UvrA [Rhodococcus erythropolis]AKE01246.1 excinuclease ABC subunit A [Rhodococcus erythropolis]
MSPSDIRISGARTHNLRNVVVDIPRDALVVFTGVSGSGKSSLAFDTIFAEGQRRYVESLSSYARMFLDRADRPDVDFIEGLSPAVAIDQKSTNRNPRSTVGTVTEIYDYLRLLWARVGVAHCPTCHARIEASTIQSMADELMTLPPRTRIQLLAPVVVDQKGQFSDLFTSLSTDGYSRVMVDGIVATLNDPPALTKNKRHSISVIVDRLAIGPASLDRLTDSLETAAKLSSGKVEVLIQYPDGNELVRSFSEHRACPNGHPLHLRDIGPRTFSFNAPAGACTTCSGIGSRTTADPELLLGDAGLSLSEGVILPWAQAGSNGSQYFQRMLSALADELEFSLRTPWQNLDESIRTAILHGTEHAVTMTYRSRTGRQTSYTADFEGVIAWIQRKFAEAETDAQRKRYSRYLRDVPCAACNGRRLAPEVLAVTVGDKNIAELTELDLATVVDYLRHLSLNDQHTRIAAHIVPEILSRLEFLLDVGLGYLTLSRTAGTLSGGEAQRIRLATQVGTGLTGVLYVLDEPSIGLHQRDNTRLIATLMKLRDLGNSVLVVEHDEETIRAADWIVDVGPGAGSEGGSIVHNGSLDSLLPKADSVTANYLSQRLSIATPTTRRTPDAGRIVRIEGARAHNLKNLSVEIPIGLLTVVTGVSGSGKSTLINDILYNTLANTLNGAQKAPGRHTRITGLEHLDKVVQVDQSPIGRTPRSNPATYTGVFDRIRTLFSETTEAKVRGYTPGRFSFNIKGGRCEECLGEGTMTIEMNFLPDVFVDCETCHGTRYNRETLDITFKGKTIADVLDMPIAEACHFFEAFTIISRHLATLHEVGLGYVKLGQSALTLSGGEAQRVKLATELQRRTRGRTVYILDEPTTGLHFHDVRNVLQLLQRLVDNGNTVIVIEHNLDVIRSADWLVDLGPEGGDGGGSLIGMGTPEVLAATPGSWTGTYLRDALNAAPRASL